MRAHKGQPAGQGSVVEALRRNSFILARPRGNTPQSSTLPCQLRRRPQAMNKGSFTGAGKLLTRADPTKADAASDDHKPS